MPPRVLASFRGGPSRSAQLGSIIGGNLAETGTNAFLSRREEIGEQERLNPIREALIASLGQGTPTTPGQQLVQSITQNPETFASLIQNPEQLNSIASLTNAAQPPQESNLTGFDTLDEINRTFQAAQDARSRGENRRAEILFSRVNDMAGVEGNLDPDLDVIHLIREGTDQIQTIQSDGRGTFFDLTGEEIQLAEGDRLLEGVTISDTTEGTLGETESRTLRDAEVSTRNFLGTVGDAITLLNESPDVNTTVARLAAGVNDLQAEAGALAGALGLDFDEALLNPETNADTFDDLGIQNRRIRSLITSLAFQAAAAAAPGDRVTENDLRRFIEEIGGSANDPRAFAAALNDISRRTVRGLNNQFRVRFDNPDFESDFGLNSLPSFIEADVRANAPNRTETDEVDLEEFATQVQAASDADLLDLLN